MTAFVPKTAFNHCDNEMCQVSAVKWMSECPDFILFCRLHYGPTELWEWT